MKTFRKRFLLAVTISGLITSSSVWAWLSSGAPIVDDGVHPASWQNAGRLIFDFEPGFPGPNEVKVDASHGFPYPISWKFWSENAGWMIMDHGLATYEPKMETVTWNSRMLKVSGFAWSENAGWISFSPRGTLDFSDPAKSDPFLDTETSKFSGFAWSENLGWIGMEWLYLDVVAPSVSPAWTVFAADKEKNFTVQDAAPAFETSYSIFVEKWDSTAKTAYQTKTFPHDFRKSKTYAIEVTDPSGNSANTDIRVVANVPAGVLDHDNVGGDATSSKFTSTLSESRIADGTENHGIRVVLRDQYGNPVIGEPGIKSVRVNASFSNDADANQLDPMLLSPLGIGNADLGDAITYQGFGLVSGIMGNSGYETNASDGVYEIKLSSIAPTKAGYAETYDRNDVKSTVFSYHVATENGHSGIGEMPETSVAGLSAPFRFTPLVSVASATNPDNWNIRVGYPTKFGISAVKNSAVAISEGKVASIIDVAGGNALLSFQEPDVMAGSLCSGYNKTVVSLSSWEYVQDWPEASLCDRSALGSSSAVYPLGSFPDNSESGWTPKIIIAAPKDNGIAFSTEISYVAGGNSVAYPSYKKTGAGQKLKNSSIKIVWITSGKYLFWIEEGNSFDHRGPTQSISKIRDMIHKNVTELAKSASVKIHDWQDYELASWPVSKDTVIVRGGDIYVTADVPNGGVPKVIIAMTDKASGKWGNVFFSKDVSSIHASVYADWSVFSGEKNGTYHSDGQTATGQLFIKGSIISNNTVGWASMTPLECPYVAATCDLLSSKRYDLNYLRAYEWTGVTSPGYNPEIPPEYAQFSTVVIYDSRMQTSPPAVLRLDDTVK